MSEASVQDKEINVCYQTTLASIAVLYCILIKIIIKKFSYCTGYVRVMIYFSIMILIRIQYNTAIEPKVV